MESKYRKSEGICSRVNSDGLATPISFKSLGSPLISDWMSMNEIESQHFFYLRLSFQCFCFYFIHLYLSMMGNQSTFLQHFHFEISNIFSHWHNYGSNITDDHSILADSAPIGAEWVIWSFSTNSGRICADRRRISFLAFKIITRIEFVSSRAFEPYQNYSNRPRETLSNTILSCLIH